MKIKKTQLKLAAKLRKADGGKSESHIGNVQSHIKTLRKILKAEAEAFKAGKIKKLKFADLLLSEAIAVLHSCDKVKLGGIKMKAKKKK